MSTWPPFHYETTCAHPQCQRPKDIGLNVAAIKHPVVDREKHGEYACITWAHIACASQMLVAIATHRGVTLVWDHWGTQMMGTNAIYTSAPFIVADELVPSPPRFRPRVGSPDACYSASITPSHIKSIGNGATLWFPNYWLAMFCNGVPTLRTICASLTHAGEVAAACVKRELQLDKEVAKERKAAQAAELHVRNPRRIRLKSCSQEQT